MYGPQDYEPRLKQLPFVRGVQHSVSVRISGSILDERRAEDASWGLDVCRHFFYSPSIALFLIIR